MALIGKSFITDEVDDLSFDVLPIDCDYVMEIVSSEIKTTKAGNGEYISNKWKILDAPNTAHIGRFVFQNINTKNPSEMAVKIGDSALAQITKALGIAVLEDTDELVGQPMKVRLGFQKGKGGYDDSNTIKKVTAEGATETGGKGEAPWTD